MLVLLKGAWCCWFCLLSQHAEHIIRACRCQLLSVLSFESAHNKGVSLSAFVGFIF